MTGFWPATTLCDKVHKRIKAVVGSRDSVSGNIFKVNFLEKCLIRCFRFFNHTILTITIKMVLLLDTLNYKKSNWDIDVCIQIKQKIYNTEGILCSRYFSIRQWSHSVILSIECINVSRSYNYKLFNIHVHKNNIPFSHAGDQLVYQTECTNI